MRWYRDVVGFAVDQKYEREGKLMAVSLRAGEARILIGQDDGAKGLNRVKGAGFSLQITTAQDIDAVASGIRKRGGTLESEPVDMPWGARLFRIADPDGFKLAISSERAVAGQKNAAFVRPRAGRCVEEQIAGKRRTTVAASPCREDRAACREWSGSRAAARGFAHSP